MKKSLIGISIVSVLILVFLIKSQTSDPEPVHWQLFESQKFGIKLNFNLTYPSSWTSPLTRAGGQFVSATFYLKEKYKQECHKNESGGTACEEFGKVAGILITPPRESDISYDNETKNNIIIDEFQGVLSSGNVKKDSDLRSHAAELSKREMRIVIPDVNGDRFEFYMKITDPEDEQIFTRIINSLIFKDHLSR